jgi:pseudouridine-5'-phosphate glycosidase/pseudouridine kinase
MTPLWPKANKTPTSIPSPKLETGDSNLSSPLSSEIIIAGAIAIDYSCDFAPLKGHDTDQSPQLHTSNPSTISQSIGGVAHNVAKAALFCGSNVSLLSVVGDDLAGRLAIQQLISEGMPTNGIEILPSSTGARTAQYIAVNDTKKDLVLAMADMGVLEHAKDLIPQWIEQFAMARPKWFVADANWDAQSLHQWFTNAKSFGARTAFEPVSTTKSTRLFTPTDAHIPVYPDHIVDIASPNVLELGAMHNAARNAGLLERQDWWTVVDALGIPSSGARNRFQDATSRELTDQGIPQQSVQLLPFIPCILTKLGSQGVLLTMLLHKEDSRLRHPESLPYIIARSNIEDSEIGGVYMRLFPPAEIVEEKDIMSVNGVGDTFLGALISALASGEKRVDEIVDFAQEAAVQTLKSRESVNPEIRQLRVR